MALDEVDHVFLAIRRLFHNPQSGARVLLQHSGDVPKTEIPRFPERCVDRRPVPPDVILHFHAVSISLAHKGRL
jgi:hypothetical protein